MEKIDIDTLNDETLEKSGGEFFSGIESDYYYFDRNLTRRKFEDGKDYYPSVMMIALKMVDSIDGYRIVYHDTPGEPRFTLITDFSYQLSHIGADTKVDDTNHWIETQTFDHYDELPYWMSSETMFKAQRKMESMKVSELMKDVSTEMTHNDKEKILETVLTALFLIVHTVLILPMVYPDSAIMHLLYIFLITLVLTRFVGRSIRLCHNYLIETLQKREKKKNE